MLSNCRSPGKADGDISSDTENSGTHDLENGDLQDASRDTSVKARSDSNSTVDLSAGQLYLIAVAALWGSYAPALR